MSHASGWMSVKQRAKQSLVELPLIISDHADWNDILRTIQEVKATQVWITHGREDALIPVSYTHLTLPTIYSV